MALTCLCGESGKLGFQYSADSQGVEDSVALIFMHKRDSTGALNGIKDSDLVDGKVPASFLQSKLEEANELDRWYLLKKIETTGDGTREAAATETRSNGNNEKTRQGLRTLAFNVIDAPPPELVGKINELACKDYTVMFITTCGNLLGRDCVDGGTEVFTGTPMFAKSTEANYVIASNTNATSAKVQAVIEFDNDLFKDADFRTFPASQIVENTKELLGVIASKVTTSSITVSGFDALIEADCSGITDVATGIAIENLENATYTVTNVTQASDLSGSTTVTALVTEGNYNFAFGAAQTSNDLITVKAIYAGFEVDFSVTIP